MRRGCVALFGSPDPDTGTERLVVLAETRETGAEAQQALRTRIVEVTVAVLGEPPDEVVLAPPHTVLKTSSGKIRRAACRELYEAENVGARGHSARWQVVRLVAGSLLPQLRCRIAAFANFTYGIYGWLLFTLLAPPTWLPTALAPRPALAWSVSRLAARIMLRLAGIPLALRGLEHLPRALRTGGEPRQLSRRHRPVRGPSGAFQLRGEARVPRPSGGPRILAGLRAQFVECFDTRQSVQAA